MGLCVRWLCYVIGVGILRFGPGLFSALGGCSGRAFATSLVTKVVINVMTLPLTVTFNVTSNMSPRGNVVATVVTKFVVSLLNNDGMRVNNPAKTFVIVVCNVVRRCKRTKLVMTALVTNMVLVLLKMFGLKTIVGFVPCPVVMNFADNVTMAVFAARVTSVFKLAFKGRGIPKSFMKG